MIDYKSVSLANQVFTVIENNIINGVYPSGEVLSESRLSKELGVSPYSHKGSSEKAGSREAYFFLS